MFAVIEVFVKTHLNGETEIEGEFKRSFDDRWDAYADADFANDQNRRSKHIVVEISE